MHKNQLLGLLLRCKRLLKNHLELTNETARFIALIEALRTALTQEINELKVLLSRDNTLRETVGETQTDYQALKRAQTLAHRRLLEGERHLSHVLADLEARKHSLENHHRHLDAELGAIEEALPELTGSLAEAPAFELSETQSEKLEALLPEPELIERREKELVHEAVATEHQEHLMRMYLGTFFEYVYRMNLHLSAESLFEPSPALEAAKENYLEQTHQLAHQVQALVHTLTPEHGHGAEMELSKEVRLELEAHDPSVPKPKFSPWALARKLRLVRR